MKMMRLFFCVIIVFVIFKGWSQERKIVFKETKITIDGIFDEPIWNELQEHTNFYNYLPTDEGIADNQTVVKLFHDQTNLYMSIVYKDTVERTQVSTLKRDVPLGLSDGFVVVVDAQNKKQNAFFFAINSLGNQGDGLIGRTNDGYGMNFNWNAVWQSKTILNGTDKQYELAIPLKSLNFDPNNPVFGMQFYTRDIKNNSWTILKNVKRNYLNFDLRFTEEFLVEALPNTSNSRFAITPSIALNYVENVVSEEDEVVFKPSLDLQYNLTSSLKVDATINPDFSQIDVDQQVTNLTRFAINFPERRNFFLENGDLFSNLGVPGVNPFYSRIVGLESDIQFGLKLSGNVTPSTRIGVLDAQTENDGEIRSQNYGVLAAEQQLSKNFTATGFWINRQETDRLEFTDDYNRVVGLNLNYKSDNNKWIGLANYGKSFTSDISGKNNFYNVGLWFNKRGFAWNAGVRNLGRNYITEVGFTPRLFNFDAINNVTIREGYTQTTAGVEYQKFYENSKVLNNIRYLNFRNNTYFDENGDINQSSFFLNSAVFFKDLSAVYYVINYDSVDLKYGFDPLGNGNSVVPGLYKFGILKIGYNSANNQKFRYRFNVQKGTFYGGDREVAGAYVNYQLLPFANIEASYDVNRIDLDELGEETFHLARFTGEIFFNNRLNWTTYVQYNTQGENLNINSRLQWEYQPLSYIYLVVTDNYNEQISRKDWGVSFKINYRLDI
ncbi:DUF5916 domain-containing protein [Aquimarina litoralis]|uniref:DUF5916 domain-containing protein n=1 Tax=Aquimarina litoralis TaxID=584605 RepID=UPI001C5836FE|nr:DUF5916 domain-containing protein [Aquimarina litoralis]MBW1297872.1 hypothetical protein [Aquimarina litoralis]